jgi:hypothetical protein
LKHINSLIEAARRDPFAGIGKPEPLLGNLTSYWSRRIDDKPVTNYKHFCLRLYAKMPIIFLSVQNKLYRKKGGK